MRSDLVFGALSHVSNRYQLCQLASKATRKLHKPNTRLQDTTNEVLVRFHSTNPGTLAPVTLQRLGPLKRVAPRNSISPFIRGVKQRFQGGLFACVRSAAFHPVLKPPFN